MAKSRKAEKDEYEEWRNPELKMEGKRSGIQNTQLMLTYKHQIPKDELHEFIEGICEEKGWEIKFIRSAHEESDSSHKYKHTHTVIEFSKAVSTRNTKLFDYEYRNSNIHPHFRVASTKNHKIRQKKYLAKQDESNADLLESEEEESKVDVEGIMKCRNTVEALETHAKRYSDVLPILAIRNIEKRQELRRWNFTPKQEGWQKEIADLAISLPDSRKVHWYYERRGGAGKSSIAKWLQITYPEDWRSNSDLGTVRDAATIIKGWIKDGWTGHGVAIDLPRSAENHDRIYTYMEAIKNGMISAQKYEGGTSFFDSPHLIVFANWPPKASKMSKDRWVIKRIKKDGSTKRLNVNRLPDANRYYAQAAIAKEASRAIIDDEFGEQIHNYSESSSDEDSETSVD